jgi:D-glycero-alpha-D-manno-heptose-7-phosphate kinase
MQKGNLTKLLETDLIEASAPCRIDCGGTLDIKTFYYTLHAISPCTFNIALNLKTRVRLIPFIPGMVKISSTGFEDEAYPIESIPYTSPLGLMFAIVSYFQAEGVHVQIESQSPPKSALGGSSTAAVALIGACSKAHTKLGGNPLSKETAVLLAYNIEDSILPVSCGIQDQLAAAFGGVNAWYWPAVPDDPPFKKNEVIGHADYTELEEHLLLAYCGIPHESVDINGKWVRDFMAGNNRSDWKKIVRCTHDLIGSLKRRNWAGAVAAINSEVTVRTKMTPEVFTDVGQRLRKEAIQQNCSARFTGSGGGGCIWALGKKDDIAQLRLSWKDILAEVEGGKLLEVKVDPYGLE